jgi:hypothetical protein
LQLGAEYTELLVGIADAETLPVAMNVKSLEPGFREQPDQI